MKKIKLPIRRDNNRGSRELRIENEELRIGDDKRKDVIATNIPKSIWGRGRLGVVIGSISITIEKNKTVELRIELKFNNEEERIALRIKYSRRKDMAIRYRLIRYKETRAGERRIRK